MIGISVNNLSLFFVGKNTAISTVYLLFQTVVVQRISVYSLDTSRRYE